MFEREARNWYVDQFKIWTLFVKQLNKFVTEKQAMIGEEMRVRASWKWMILQSHKHTA